MGSVLTYHVVRLLCCLLACGVRYDTVVLYTIIVRLLYAIACADVCQCVCCRLMSVPSANVCAVRAQRQVKRALGAQCFPVGGYAIQAYLPDEEVGISAFLCHGQEKSWFVRVNETLCKVRRSLFQLHLRGGLGWGMGAWAGVAVGLGGGNSVGWGSMSGESGTVVAARRNSRTNDQVKCAVSTNRFTCTVQQLGFSWDHAAPCD